MCPPRALSPRNCVTSMFSSCFLEASFSPGPFSTRFAILIFGAGHPAINYLLLLAIADDALGMAAASDFEGMAPSKFSKWPTRVSFGDFCGDCCGDFCGVFVQLEAIIAIAYPNPAHPVEPVWQGPRRFKSCGRLLGLLSMQGSAGLVQPTNTLKPLGCCSLWLGPSSRACCEWLRPQYAQCASCVPGGAHSVHSTMAWASHARVD